MKKPAQEWEDQAPTSIPRKSPMPDPARAPFLLAGFPTARADRTYRDGSRSVCRRRRGGEPRDALMAAAEEAACRGGGTGAALRGATRRRAYAGARRRGVSGR